MTYKRIQEEYRKIYHTTIKTCWIADVKRQLGFDVKEAFNRQGRTIINRCPQHIIAKISQIINDEKKAI